MKQHNNPHPHAGSNPLRIGGIQTICRIMRIDDTGTVLFRNADLLGTEFKHQEVPYVTLKMHTPEGEKVERYYFCRRYLVQGSLYLPYLVKTNHLSDEDVVNEVPHMLSPEDLVLDMKLSADTAENSGWSYEARKALFEKCVHKYYKTYSASEVARLLFTTEKTVRMYLNSLTKVLNNTAVIGSDGGPPVVRRLKDSPEYRAIQKEVHAARVKARNTNPPITDKFTIADVLVRVDDVQGNVGRAGLDRVVPKVCPVLRIPLDYNVFENNKGLNKIRVWRKTPGPDGMAPLTGDNVVIMSRAAAWAIEGAYGQTKLADLSVEMREALAQWQAKYGTRTVPRVTRVGRPRKEK